MHWINDHRKYMPCRTGQQCSGFTLIIAPRDAPFNIRLHLCAFCSVTAHAHQKSRVCSNNMPIGIVYVVYLFLFAVVLLCCDMLWYSCTVLWQGFIFVCMFTWCFFTQNHHLFSFCNDLCDLMSINSYYAILCLYEWMQRRVFLYHTDWSARDARVDFSICCLNEDINTLTTSSELLWESLHELFTVSFE